MQYPCRVQVLLSATAMELLQRAADDRQMTVGEAARYLLTSALNQDSRKQEKRRNREQALLDDRRKFLTAIREHAEKDV